MDLAPSADFALFSSLFEDLANEFQGVVHEGDAALLGGQQAGQHGQHVRLPPTLPTSLMQLQQPQLEALQSYTTQGPTLFNTGPAAAKPWGASPNYNLIAQLVPTAAQPSSATAVRKAPSSRRKRPPNMQDQVAELMQKVQLQETIAKNLAGNNIWLAERNSMMEQIIKVADNQTIRLRAMKDGLSFDPMVGLGTSFEAVKTATPNTVASFLLRACVKVASQMAAIEPLLQTNPHLITDTRLPPIFKTAVMNEPLAPHEPVCPIIPPLKDRKHEHVLPELRELLMDVPKMTMAYMFLYLTKPEVLQACSVRLQAMQDTEGTSWTTLRSSITNSSDLPDPVPVIAPETVWQNVAKALRMTDKQRLCMAVLWDIVDGGRKVVHKQRAQLASAVAQVLQAPNGGPTPTPTPSYSQPQSIPHQTAQQQPARSHHSGISSSSGYGVSSSDSPPVMATSSPQSDAHAVRTAANPSLSDLLFQATDAFLAVHNCPPQQLQRLPTSGESGSGSGEAAEFDSVSTTMYELEAKAAVWKSSEVVQREARLVEKLQHTLIKERCLMLLGCEAMFTHVFSPIQSAMIMVSCYPYMPDQMAIMHAAAAEFQPFVLERLVTAAHPDWA